MSVSAISSAQTTEQTQSLGRKTSPKKDFEALQNALDSGDLDAAKSAFETIKKNRPSGPPPGPPPDGAASKEGSGGGMKDAMDSLEKALSSSDVSSAKKIFEQIQELMKNGPGGTSQGSSATTAKSVSRGAVGLGLDLSA